MGDGPTYQKRHKGQVQCRDYGEEMLAVSLAEYRITQHGKVAEERWICKTSDTGEKPRT